MSLSVIILAAGKGSRMKSDLPKFMHKIANQPIINHIIEIVSELSPNEIILTINNSLDYVKQIINYDIVRWAYQEFPLGTANAVSSSLSQISQNCEYILILCADTPLITSSTIEQFYHSAISKNSDISLIAFDANNPSGYGRVISNSDEILKIIEEKDANPEELKVELCNSGIMLVKKNILQSILPLIKNDNSQKEYYLTDVIKIARDQNLKCNYFVTEQNEVLGVNDRVQLTELELIYQKKMRNYFMNQGVTLIDPNSVFFSYDTQIAADTIIHPHVVFGIDVKIEKNVEIKSFSHLEGVLIKSGAKIGPFARIRPNTIIYDNAVIGNFVEVKNSIVDIKAKISHLSYIGDSNIGQNTNIGAGVITCNYDGFNKYKTYIGDSVFVGAGSILIAPLNIEKDSIIAAGSVVNKNVAKDAIAISRPELKILQNSAKKYKYRKSKI